MKKLMLVLSVAGLTVAGLIVGCSSEQGGTSDQNQMNSGSSYNTPANTTTNSVNTPPNQQ